MGKGKTKARKESENTARAVVEQVSIAFADGTFEQARTQIAQRIEQDVRSELIHITKLFRRYIIGIPGSKSGPTGILSTVSKGTYNPTASIKDSIPRWTPLRTPYANYKQSIGLGNKWFQYDGDLGRTFKPLGGDGASGTGGGGDFTTLNGQFQTVFEDIFGPIQVQILRNNRAWGTNTGAGLIVGKGRKFKMQLGTIRVKALGSLTPGMLKPSNDFNAPLMGLVERYDPMLSYRLGNRWRYRPSLEPFLSFFLERSIPQAVTERLRRGVLSATLFRQPG